MNAKKTSIRILCSAICMLMLFVLSMPCFVYAMPKEKVTVAYIDYNNFITKTQDGSYAGYGADYLNRIAKYTGWEYEFVNMTWTEAYKAVKNGTVDFYCVARQTDERQPDFDFSLYPVCNEEMNIYAMPEKEIYYEDFSEINGKKVGMLASSGEIDYFKQYANDNGFNCQIVEYPMNEDAIRALKNNEVDMIALVNYSVSGDFKLIGNFGVSPAYMMSCDGSKYMAAFSKAQEKLFFDDPTFATTLENKYYGDSDRFSDIMLTRDEAEYIENIKENKESINVALSVDMAPIEYYDKADNTYKGLTVDLYKRISEMTGIKFNFVDRPDADTLKEMMKNGEITLIGAMAQSELVADKLALTQSTAFYENTMSQVSKNISALTNESTVVVPAGYPQFIEIAKQNGYTHIVTCKTFEECVKAVYDGKADMTYIISMSEGYLLGHTKYSKLQSMVCPESAYGVCFGADNGCDTRLISIINKCISAIPNREVSELIVSNTSLAKPHQTLFDFMINNVALILVIFIILLALITVLIIKSQKEKQQKKLNAKLKQHHDFLQHLYNTLPCGVFRYEYEAPHRIINYNVSCAKIYGFDDSDFPIVGERPDRVVAAGTENDFQKKFSECAKNDGPITYEWPITKKDGSTAYTESVMDIVETEDGNVFQEVLIDITERKRHETEIKKRYARELSRAGKREEGLLFIVCIDITDQIITESDIDVEGVVPGISVDEFLRLLSPGMSDLQSKEWLENFKSEFSPEQMQLSYENGQVEKSIKLCRRHEGKIQWLRSDLTLRHHPVTGHLMCFDYIWDITDENISKQIMRSMALSDCDCFLNIDMTTLHCLQYEVMNNKELDRSEAVYGKNDILTVMAEQMSSEDMQEFKKSTDLAQIKEKLKTCEFYQVYATLNDKENNRQDKLISYFYTNQDGGILAATIADVTEIRASEIRHAQLLSDALIAAEKADVAKSQFLSRVSHEMRTPLNAIIGFIELAKDADAEKIANCLASSDIAAKQLLNVINDVLDMSSIESGKMKIANASFNFRHLVTSITNIYGTQCRQKGIIFESRITTPVDEWLIGDELRVNQILMNLLGNAVKFTSDGYIHLVVSETPVEDSDKVFIRFTVADTGCGMSEQMKERMFKPFEQESATTARKYGGSGLGLSIVKSLVGMMEGKISVESSQGEGTSFIVDLPFRKSDVTSRMALPKEVDTLHILTIDDEPSEREYMSLVLTRMGVRFTAVCGGEEALRELEKSHKENDIYNVCLVDWCMPGMNGVETTKKIRDKYGKELVVIVVSAYDFQQAGDSAMEAGANLFLSKPIFQSSLFDLFMTLTGGKIAKPKDEPQAWNFTGKRVLLAEDNVLNQIVAKGYLAKYNVVVELAEDGQKAVEMFEKSEPGYYDAVLMDIQMPIMDGYEATRAIRNSKHSNAKTIQIIAQSADAFNEDIAKALSAGMNAHVAKPIKPDVLAKALSKAFQQQKTDY